MNRTLHADAHRAGHIGASSLTDRVVKAGTAGPGEGGGHALVVGRASTTAGVFGARATAVA